jgi:hypothetical protein
VKLSPLINEISIEGQSQGASGVKEKAFERFKELQEFRRARSILAWPRSDLEAA